MGNRVTACLLALALGSAVLVAGCGGGDEADPKQEYIKQGDQICLLGTFQISQESQKLYGKPQPPPSEQSTFAEKTVVPILRVQVLNKLRSLTAPPGDEQQVAAIWAALGSGIDALKANPALLAQPGAGGAFDEANRLAQAYGFHQCGSG
jgi:hypothetical protein